MPWPSSSTTSDRVAAVGPDADVHAAAVGRVAEGVVDEDPDELAEPRGIAAHLGRYGVDDERPPAFGMPSSDIADAPDDATSPRSTGMTLQLDGARIRAGEQQQVLDHRGQVVDLVADVGQRRADVRYLLLRVPLQVIDARSDDGQRRSQLVRGVRRELALASECLALVDQRLADRHEGPFA